MNTTSVEEEGLDDYVGTLWCVGSCFRPVWRFESHPVCVCLRIRQFIQGCLSRPRCSEYVTIRNNFFNELQREFVVLKVVACTTTSACTLKTPGSKVTRKGSIAVIPISVQR